MAGEKSFSDDSLDRSTIQPHRWRREECKTENAASLMNIWGLKRWLTVKTFVNSSDWRNALLLRQRWGGWRYAGCRQTGWRNGWVIGEDALSGRTSSIHTSEGGHGIFISVLIPVRWRTIFVDECISISLFSWWRCWETGYEKDAEVNFWKILDGTKLVEMGSRYHFSNSAVLFSCHTEPHLWYYQQTAISTGLRGGLADHQVAKLLNITFTCWVSRRLILRPGWPLGLTLHENGQALSSGLGKYQTSDLCGWDEDWYLGRRWRAALRWNGWFIRTVLRKGHEGWHFQIETSYVSKELLIWLWLKWLLLL
jgi:hypothetical protein